MHSLEGVGLDSHTACQCHGKDGPPLTHCLRAWFLRLKYKISFFRIAWFLGSTDGGSKMVSSQQELRLISTGPQSEGSPLSLLSPEPTLPLRVVTVTTHPP